MALAASRSLTAVTEPLKWAQKGVVFPAQKNVVFPSRIVVGSALIRRRRRRGGGGVSRLAGMEV